MSIDIEQLEELSGLVREDHIMRKDVPTELLVPRPYKRRPRPKTAIIAEYAAAKYAERMAEEAWGKLPGVANEPQY